MSCQDTQSAEQRVNQKEAHFQRESFTLSDNKNDHHKFIKLLNSLIFIETDDSIWETWNIKIADKLNVNANHYSTEKICIVYVIFRLEDDADQQIYAKHHVDAFSFYQSLEVFSTRCTFRFRAHFTLLLSSFFKNQLQIQYDFNWGSACRSSFAKVI